MSYKYLTLFLSRHCHDYTVKKKKFKIFQNWLCIFPKICKPKCYLECFLTLLVTEAEKPKPTSCCNSHKVK